MKIIFLDIDGVLNCQDAYKNFDLGRDEFGDNFYEPSKKLLNRVVEETGAKVVISSTWRLSGFEIMKEMWNKRGMSGEVLDITPFLRFKNCNNSVPRGCEIESWLSEQKFYITNYNKVWQQEIVEKSGIENYVIIDDDIDMLLEQKNNFVNVEHPPENEFGFNEKHYNEVKRILNTDFCELNHIKC